MRTEIIIPLQVQQKNIHIPYGIDSHRYQKSPSYCSKIVWQAYYYGSGDAKVVIPGSGIISPYALPNVTFYKEYGISVMNMESCYFYLKEDES